MMQTLFWIFISLIMFAYFGYPLSLYFLNVFIKKRVAKKSFLPNVTLIITAYNEEKGIKQKLENTIKLEYPRDKLQVILASDGSSDRTNLIVSEYKKHAIELLALEEHRGKENSQKEAVKKARGEILVFSDAATRLDPEGIKEIVANFTDPFVGCVSSEDRMIDMDGNPSGEGLYVRYEMWLRSLEAKVCSLVGLSGSFFAARKDVCHDFSGEMQSDFRTLLSCVKMGLRGVPDPQAVGYYSNVSDEKREFERKVRTVVRGLNVFFQHLEFLNPFRYGLFSYQYFCHKLLRWLVPFFLLVAFAMNSVLAFKSHLFLIFLLCQLVFYWLAIWAWRRKTPPSYALLKIPMYFLTVNTSIFVAWWKYLEGQRPMGWTPSER